MTFPLTIRDSRVRVRLEADLITFTLEKGDPVELSVRGDGVVVGPEAPVSVELHGQGGRLQSLQGSHPLIGGRRPDGSVIQAVVPESHPQEIVVDEG